MRDYTKFYINGAWVAPSGSDTLAVENPATLETAAKMMGIEPADLTKVRACATPVCLFSLTDLFIVPHASLSA